MNTHRPHARILAIAGGLLSAASLALALQAPTRPDAVRTPGATNPAITPANIAQNICKKGWSTKSIRPTSSYTTTLKRQQMAAQHLSGATKDYEEDHLISLELGGAPKDPHNLWPEPWVGTWNAHDKDKLENELHRRVCAGTLGLREAQRAIASDWIAAYRTYVGQ